MPADHGYMMRKDGTVSELWQRAAGLSLDFLDSGLTRKMVNWHRLCLDLRKLSQPKLIES